jgi:hypothetical protein
MTDLDQAWFLCGVCFAFGLRLIIDAVILIYGRRR